MLFLCSCFALLLGYMRTKEMNMRISMFVGSHVLP